MLHLDCAGGDSEADVCMVLCRLIGGHVKGTLGWRVQVSVPTTPSLVSCPKGLEVWWLWRWLLLLLLPLLLLPAKLGPGPGPMLLLPLAFVVEDQEGCVCTCFIRYVSDEYAR